MAESSESESTIADDVATLREMGYTQELARRMGAFSNFAVSLSMICILAGGITSFHLGICSVGGAAIGIVWPLSCAFSLIVALAMAQVASAFPTAGGLYHWASILGGRGWGWATAWFNLAGLITVLAAINVGTFHFCMGAFWPHVKPGDFEQFIAMLLITGSQAILNHLGIRVTAWLTDFSGYLILIVSAILTAALLVFAPTHDLTRLVTFTNFSGLPSGDHVWPQTESIWWLCLLGILLPAYTITGFDASAHTAEETVGASENVPRGIVRSVLVSGVAGWILLSALVLAMPSVSEAAEHGTQVVFWTLRSVLPTSLALVLFAAISVAQYLCGLATVTSASRMTYAFARDGGLPFSHRLRLVSPTFQSPVAAIWAVAVSAIVFTVYTPVYSTITAVCVIFLYLSYVLPTVLGYFAYGKSWRRMGPWSMGVWYRPAAIISVVGCLGLIVIGMQPPNDNAVWVVAGSIFVLTGWWWIRARHVFPGPPSGVLELTGND
ncbi:MAG: amino acid permease [Planctomycetaceae bacterium]|nr:amino acid permease [Planctomycetaceae bacterium]